MRMKQQYGDWALVTGATSGIGKAVAAELAAKQLNLVLVSRNEAQLAGEKADLEAAHGITVRTVAVDLTEPDALDQVASATEDLEIGVLVPNAGVALTGEFADSDQQANARLVQLNVVAPLMLAHRYGREMALRERGAILFVSSLFGYQGVPYVSNYAATKAYILSLGEALSVELGRRNVHVTVLSPGLTDTKMPAAMPLDFSRLPMLRHTPAYVARIGVRALGRRASVVPGLVNKLYAFQNRLVPRMFPVRLFGFLLRSALTGTAQLKQKLRPDLDPAIKDEHLDGVH